MVDAVLTKYITADEVALRESEEGTGREIINGAWAEDNEMAGERHGLLGLEIAVALREYVKGGRLGRVYPDNVNYVLDGEPGNIVTMHIPDVSFVAATRTEPITDGYLYMAPDLAVEVVSPGERDKITQGKITDYLRFGTAQVWVVHPDTRQVVVHCPDDITTTYREGDILQGEGELAGFSLNIAELFNAIDN